MLRASSKAARAGAKRASAALARAHRTSSSSAPAPPSSASVAAPAVGQQRALFSSSAAASSVPTRSTAAPALTRAEAVALAASLAGSSNSRYYSGKQEQQEQQQGQGSRATVALPIALVAAAALAFVLASSPVASPSPARASSGSYDDNTLGDLIIVDADTGAALSQAAFAARAAAAAEAAAAAAAAGAPAAAQDAIFSAVLCAVAVLAEEATAAASAVGNSTGGAFMVAHADSPRSEGVAPAAAAVVVVEEGVITRGGAVLPDGSVASECATVPAPAAPVRTSHSLLSPAPYASNPASLEHLASTPPDVAPNTAGFPGPLSPLAETLASGSIATILPTIVRPGPFARLFDGARELAAEWYNHVTKGSLESVHPYPHPTERNALDEFLASRAGSVPGGLGTGLSYASWVALVRRVCSPPVDPASAEEAAVAALNKATVPGAGEDSGLAAFERTAATSASTVNTSAGAWGFGDPLNPLYDSPSFWAALARIPRVSAAASAAAAAAADAVAAGTLDPSAAAAAAAVAARAESLELAASLRLRAVYARAQARDAARMNAMRVGQGLAALETRVETLHNFTNTERVIDEQLATPLTRETFVPPSTDPDVIAAERETRRQRDAVADARSEAMRAAAASSAYDGSRERVLEFDKAARAAAVGMTVAALERAGAAEAARAAKKDPSAVEAAYRSARDVSYATAEVVLPSRTVLAPEGKSVSPVVSLPPPAAPAQEASMRAVALQGLAKEAAKKHKRAAAVLAAARRRTGESALQQQEEFREPQRASSWADYLGLGSFFQSSAVDHDDIDSLVPVVPFEDALAAADAAAAEATAAASLAAEAAAAAFALGATPDGLTVPTVTHPVTGERLVRPRSPPEAQALAVAALPAAAAARLTDPLWLDMRAEELERRAAAAEAAAATAAAAAGEVGSASRGHWREVLATLPESAAASVAAAAALGTSKTGISDVTELSVPSPGFLGSGAAAAALQSTGGVPGHVTQLGVDGRPMPSPHFDNGDVWDKWFPRTHPNDTAYTAAARKLAPAQRTLAGREMTAETGAKHTSMVEDNLGADLPAREALLGHEKVFAGATQPPAQLLPPYPPRMPSDPPTDPAALPLTVVVDVDTLSVGVARDEATGTWTQYERPHWVEWLQSLADIPGAEIVVWGRPRRLAMAVGAAATEDANAALGLKPGEGSFMDSAFETELTTDEQIKRYTEGSVADEAFDAAKYRRLLLRRDTGLAHFDALADAELAARGDMKQWWASQPRVPVLRKIKYCMNAESAPLPAGSTAGADGLPRGFDAAHVAFEDRPEVYVPDSATHLTESDQRRVNGVVMNDVRSLNRDPRRVLLIDLNKTQQELYPENSLLVFNDSHLTATTPCPSPDASASLPLRPAPAGKAQDDAVELASLRHLIASAALARCPDMRELAVGWNLAAAGATSGLGAWKEQVGGLKSSETGEVRVDRLKSALLHCVHKATAARAALINDPKLAPPPPIPAAAHAAARNAATRAASPAAAASAALEALTPPSAFDRLEALRRDARAHAVSADVARVGGAAARARAAVEEIGRASDAHADAHAGIEVGAPSSSWWRFWTWGQAPSRGGGDGVNEGERALMALKRLPSSLAGVTVDASAVSVTSGEEAPLTALTATATATVTSAADDAALQARFPRLAQLRARTSPLSLAPDTPGSAFFGPFSAAVTSVADRARGLAIAADAAAAEEAAAAAAEHARVLAAVAASKHGSPAAAAADAAAAAAAAAASSAAAAAAAAKEGATVPPTAEIVASAAAAAAAATASSAADTSAELAAAGPAFVLRRSLADMAVTHAALKHAASAQTLAWADVAAGNVPPPVAAAAAAAESALLVPHTGGAFAPPGTGLLTPAALRRLGAVTPADRPAPRATIAKAAGARSAVEETAAGKAREAQAALERKTVLDERYAGTPVGWVRKAIE